MGYPTVTNYDPHDGIRAVNHDEQGVITFAGAATVAKCTILGRITATGKYCYYSSGDSPAGSANIQGVSLNEVVATGAGDKPIGVMRNGTVDEDLLIIQGNDPGVGITDAIKDALNDIGIRVVNYTDPSILDNQT